MSVLEFKCHYITGSPICDITSSEGTTAQPHLGTLPASTLNRPMYCKHVCVSYITEHVLCISKYHSKEKVWERFFFKTYWWVFDAILGTREMLLLLDRRSKRGGKLCQHIWLAVLVSAWILCHKIHHALLCKSTRPALTSQTPGSGILPLICCHGGALWRREQTDKVEDQPFAYVKTSPATGILPHRQRVGTV